MPLMMDEGIDVDDLFGDPTSLELGLTSSPASTTIKGLSQRLDELRLMGCCRKLAWSKLGAIVYISSDGQKVFLRHLVCKSDSGKWSLSDEDPLNPIAEAHRGHTFVHLSWNDAGSELAVVDSCGRVVVVAISIAFNVVTMSRSALMDSDDDGNQPVALMWLGMNRPVHAFSKATRANGRWAYSRYPRRPLGPFHPLTKPALAWVTRSGHLKLLYQNLESKWGEVSIELHNIGYSDGILTHAAMCPVEGGGIMVVTYSKCGELRLYRAQVKWESTPPQLDPSHQRPNNPLVTPSLHLVHIKSGTPKATFHRPEDDVERPDRSAYANSSFSMTHLEITTGSLDAPGGSSTGPYIFAVFSSPCHTPDLRSQLAAPFSVLVRWEFGPVTQSLHASFDNIITKTSVHQLKPKIDLQRQDLYFERRVVAIDYMEAGNVLAVTFDNSSVSFYDGKTISLLNGFDDVDTVTSMAQAGFGFPTDGTGLHISFSPSGCLAAVLDDKAQLQLRVMGHSFGAEGGLFNDGKFTSAIAALTLAYARACGNDCNFDDLLMIVVQQLTADTQKEFINEVYRALSMNVDYTPEQDKLMNNPYIHKCLSMQAALGFKSRINHHGLVAAVPWVTLQLRHTSILLAYFHYNKGGSESECYDPDILRMVFGNVKWALDLAKYLVDDLCEMADNYNSNQSDNREAASPAKHLESLSVFLILASIPRSFLKYICRGLRGIANGLRNATNLSNESHQIYSRIIALITESPLKVDVYEKFLASIDNVVKHTYQNAGFGNSDRAAPERDLLISGSIPPVLQPAVTTILTSTMPMIRSEANLMILALHDYSWLGIDNDKPTGPFKQRSELDILKKITIGLDKSRDGARQPRRRCVRCCAVTEDVTSPKPSPTFRMLVRTVVMRSCTCGGTWVMENVDNLDLDSFSMPSWKQTK